MIKKAVYSLVLLLALTNTRCPSAELIYRGQEGDVRYYRSTASLDIVTRIDSTISRGKEIPLKTTTWADTKKATVVLRILPGDAITQEIQRVKSETTDAAGKPDSPWDEPVTVGMTPQGKVVGIYGLVEIVNKKQAEKAEAKSGESDEKKWQELELKQYIKRSFGQMFPVFPEKVVVKGESWQYCLEAIKMPGLPVPLDLEYTYTYAGDKVLDDAKCAVLKVGMKFDALDFKDVPAGQIGGFSVPPDIKGIPTFLRLKSFKGKLYFDYREGRIRKVESTAVMIMGLRVPADEKNQIFGYTAELEMTLKRTTDLSPEP